MGKGCIKKRQKEIGVFFCNGIAPIISEICGNLRKQIFDIKSALALNGGRKSISLDNFE